ncbi:hydrolase [Flexivirga endophytica]|uniref:Hydrolase n=1 Tax=Flexivirga endophytica TaxID=1849103 RepID=A0A916SVT9_9MICO|nr:alpha/beta hydrolase [Flexivirga endophytica]GGB18898.1 hydrolase [Flexivirga endophytica]GHB36775.1 hydrolase [Flexivirga endophytica]
MRTTQQQLLPVYDYRPGDGPTLVFLHYWGGSARTWDLVVGRFEDRAVLTLDLRGWSRSRTLPGPYTLHQLAADTFAAIADAGIADYVLIGHSMGGKVAQLVASIRPTGLRGLILVAPGPAKPAAEVTAEYREALSHAYDSDASVASARDNVLTAIGLPESASAQVVADSRASADAARTEWPLHGIAEDITEHTRLIDVPALVVAGENDQVEPAHVLRDNLVPYLSDVDFLVVPRSGHLIPLEAPADLADAITGFSTGLSGGCRSEAR